MIYASLNAKKGNYQYPAAIATALEFLAKPETAELPVGRYELDGDNIFVLIRQIVSDHEHRREPSRQQLQLRIREQKAIEIISISSIFSQERKYRAMHHFFQVLQVKNQQVRIIFSMQM